MLGLVIDQTDYRNGFPAGDVRHESDVRHVVYGRHAGDSYIPVL